MIPLNVSSWRKDGWYWGITNWCQNACFDITISIGLSALADILKRYEICPERKDMSQYNELFEFQYIKFQMSLHMSKGCCNNNIWHMTITIILFVLRKLCSYLPRHYITVTQFQTIGRQVCMLHKLKFVCVLSLCLADLLIDVCQHNHM